MRKVIKLIGIASVLLITSISTFAQGPGAVSATATASATIVATLQISKQVDMDFGNLAVNANNGTCVLPPDANPVRTITGGVQLPAVVGTVTAAQFQVDGEANYTFDITLPSTDLVITNTTSGNSETMIVNTFTSTPSGSGQLSAGGQATIYVGATCNVNGDQVPGLYVSATPFEVFVNYN